jgi:uncharacterized protein (TIGR00369 family)
MLWAGSVLGGETVSDNSGSRYSYDIPLHDYMGLHVEFVEDGAKVTVPLTHAIKGGVAPVHGGIVATLVDVACASSVGRDWDQSTEIPVSTDLHVRYFSQPKVSPLVAEAHVVHRGSRIIGVECTVRDGADRQVARGNGTYMIVPGFGELAEGPPKGLRGQ